MEHVGKFLLLVFMDTYLFDFSMHDNGQLRQNQTKEFLTENKGKRVSMKKEKRWKKNKKW